MHTFVAECGDYVVSSVLLKSADYYSVDPRLGERQNASSKRAELNHSHVRARMEPFCCSIVSQRYGFHNPDVAGCINDVANPGLSNATRKQKRANPILGKRA